MSQVIYETHLALVNEVTRFVCRRQRFHAAEAEDFQSYVHLRMLEKNCAILASFKGGSSLRTYLVPKQAYQLLGRSIDSF